MTSNVILAILFIALTPIPWWAVAVVWRALQRDPGGTALRELGQRFMIAGVAGLAVAGLAANYLLGITGLPQLPRGAGLVLLALALFAIYAQPGWFLIQFYRHR